MPPPVNYPPPPPPPSHEKRPIGPVIGALIIIVLLALGALYFWGAHLNQQNTTTYPLIPGNATTTE